MTKGIERMTGQPSIQELFLRQRARSLQLRAEPIAHRKERLLKLRRWIKANRSRIHDAAFKDFKKPATEVDGIEIFHVLSEIKLAVGSLDRWSRPKKVDAPLTMLGTRSSVHYEPKGVCLIIAPWNYPFSLAIGPLVSALAAGNTVILKPSELTTHVSRLMKDMADELFPDEEVAVVEGGAEVSQTLLGLPFDHIFFTGSPEIGKIVMKAAADNLSSVTLELGGKSPCIVTASASIAEAAERIAVAKFVNNGQTCVAPDYVMVHESVIDDLIASLLKKMSEHFGGATGNFSESGDYCRIVNDRHHQRLVNLLRDATDRGAIVHTGGSITAQERYFHPVIVSNLPEDARLLQEEIFGPILPVVAFKTLAQAIDFINSRPKPLALYLFSRERREIENVLAETSSGGVCIRDCAIHFLHHGLPFGGVNSSGMGKSHGHHGFMAFSNEKPVLIQKAGMTSVKLFYPPYTKASGKLMDWFLKLF